MGFKTNGLGQTTGWQGICGFGFAIFCAQNPPEWEVSVMSVHHIIDGVLNPNIDL
jgi:hypothetical protein